MATITTYKTTVQAEVADSSSRASTVIEEAIKQTYQEILTIAGEWLISVTEEDVTATIDQRYIETTSEFQDIDRVLWLSPTSSSYLSMGSISADDYYDRHINRDSGDPLHYYRTGAGTRVYFDVAPATAGTVKVVGRLVQNEISGAEVSVIPDRFANVLILGAVARFKAYEEKEDAREYYKQYRGPYYEQGKIGGALKHMLDELQTNETTVRPKLYGI